MINQRNLIGSAEAAELLGIDRATLLRWTRSGKLLAVHQTPGVRGAYLFDRAQIERIALERVTL